MEAIGAAVLDEVVITGLATSSAGAAITALLGTADSDEVVVAGTAVAGAVLVRTAVPGIVPRSDADETGIAGAATDSLGTAEDTAPDDAATGIAASAVAVIDSLGTDVEGIGGARPPCVKLECVVPIRTSCGAEKAEFVADGTATGASSFTGASCCAGSCDTDGVRTPDICV